MQKDTRRMTVAREHLVAAVAEVQRAQGQPEQSMREQAVRRALDHMNLVMNRLTQERALSNREAHGGDIEEAFNLAESGWQHLSAMMQDPDAMTRLETVRQNLGRAVACVEQACDTGMEEEALHA
jgi:hypothetical protein